MVIFDQLRFSDDGKRIYIDIHVSSADYFNDVYLDEMAIKVSDKVLEATTPELYSKDSDGNIEDAVYVQSFGDDAKKASLVLSYSDLQGVKSTEMSKTLFFVYVKCKGTPAYNTPCTLDEMTTVSVTFDEKCLWQKVMGYTKSLADSCTVPLGFVDFILLWNAFKASIETGHYVPAINYWKMLFGDVNDGIGAYTTSNCGCHG